MEKAMENAERTQDALQLEALLVVRTYLYTLFHKLMGGEPDEQLLAVLLDGTTADVVDEFAAESEELRAFEGFLAGLRTNDASEQLDRVRETVDALKKAKLRDRVFVMVGGAAASQEFADEIEADAFTLSAEDAADKAREFMSL